MRHNDLDPRYTPISWIYSEVLERVIEYKSTALSYNRSGTLVGMTRAELFNTFKKFASQCIYISLDGSSEIRILTSYIRGCVIEIKTYKKGRDVTKASITAVLTNFDAFKELIEIAKQHIKVTKGNTIYCVGQGHSSLTLQDLGSLEDQLVRDNYDNLTLEKTDYMIEQINNPNPKGRLVIINGPAGSGKTSLIKGIIPQLKHSLIILLPTRLISEVDGPALVSLLADWKDEYGWEARNREINPSIVLILEDADECLTTRNDSNMSTVSSMLNHTDGIFGSMLDLRLIATTNASQLEFDKAFTRPGRLCVHITIDKLHPEHAMEIYTRITGGKKRKYKEPITLAEVYAHANNNPYGHIEEEKKLGFKA